MIPHHVDYQLAILGLLWLWVMLPYAWPSRCALSPPRLAKPVPITFKHTRSKEPKSFEGLTYKPHCAACEHDATHPKVPPPRRPDPMPPTHRRPRTIDTSRHFCPHAGCDYQGWLGLGNLRANGHPSGGLWRQLYCRACKGYFLETHGTLLHGKRLSVELIVHVLACLAEGLGIRATARVFEVDPNTVLRWLVEAAEQLQAFSAHVLCDVHVRQLQLDELYAVLRGVKNGEISKDNAIKRLERSRHWVWTAIDPESKLLLATAIGPRTLAMAQRVVHQVAHVLAPDCVPLFVTDGFREYLTALLTHYGQWIQPERRRATGARRKARWVPLPQLCYAQVVKSYRRRRIVGVKHHVVFGTMARVKQVLSTCGRQINTQKWRVIPDNLCRLLDLLPLPRHFCSTRCTRSCITSSVKRCLSRKRLPSWLGVSWTPSLPLYKWSNTRYAHTGNTTERVTRSASLVTCIRPKCKPLLSSFMVSSTPHLHA